MISKANPAVLDLTEFIEDLDESERAAFKGKFLFYLDLKTMTKE
mgnify:CR=1 FL=1